MAKKELLSDKKILISDNTTLLLEVAYGSAKAVEILGEQLRTMADEAASQPFAVDLRATNR